MIQVSSLNLLSYEIFLESHRISIRSFYYTLIAVLTLHGSVRLVSSFMADWKSHMFIIQQ